MPDQFIQERFLALQRGDYAAVYQSYHSEAPFVQNFAREADYVDFASEHLSRIQVVSWRCLAQREAGAGVEVILVMELEVDGIRQLFFELALLLETPQGWKYHSAQKLSPEEFTEHPDRLDFSHFDLAAQKVRF